MNEPAKALAWLGLACAMMWAFGLACAIIGMVLHIGG